MRKKLTIVKMNNEKLLSLMKDLLSCDGGRWTAETITKKLVLDMEKVDISSVRIRLLMWLKRRYSHVL